MCLATTAFERCGDIRLLNGIHSVVRHLMPVLKRSIQAAPQLNTLSNPSEIVLVEVSVRKARDVHLSSQQLASVFSGLHKVIVAFLSVQTLPSPSYMLKPHRNTL